MYGMTGLSIGVICFNPDLKTRGIQIIQITRIMHIIQIVKIIQITQISAFKLSAFDRSMEMETSLRCIKGGLSIVLSILLYRYSSNLSGFRDSITV